MWSVQIQEMVCVDEEVAQVLHFGFELLWRYGKDADKLEKVKKERFADFEEVVCVVERPGWLRGRLTVGICRRRGRVQLGDALIFQGR